MAKILLDEALENKGKSLYWLAQITGINHALLFRYQKNSAQRITLTHVDLICAALECEAGDLIQKQKVKLPSRKKTVSKKQ